MAAGASGGLGTGRNVTEECVGFGIDYAKISAAEIDTAINYIDVKCRP
jgi:hypothetical protein